MAPSDGNVKLNLSISTTKQKGISSSKVSTLKTTIQMIDTKWHTLMSRNGFVIAHNMKHEDPILKWNLNKEQQVQWGDAPKCDTCNIKLLKYLPTSAWEKYKTRTLGVNLVELYGVVHPTKDDSCVDSWHMAMADVKMTWAIFLYYVTSVSYNEIKWKNDSKVKRKSMIPAYKTYERSLQKRKFNGC